MIPKREKPENYHGFMTSAAFFDLAYSYGRMAQGGTTASIIVRRGANEAALVGFQRQCKNGPGHVQQNTGVLSAQFFDRSK